MLPLQTLPVTHLVQDTALDAGTPDSLLVICVPLKGKGSAWHRIKCLEILANSMQASQTWTQTPSTWVIYIPEWGPSSTWDHWKLRIKLSYGGWISKWNYTRDWLKRLITLLLIKGMSVYQVQGYKFIVKKLQIILKLTSLSLWNSSELNAHFTVKLKGEGREILLTFIKEHLTELRCHLAHGKHCL